MIGISCDSPDTTSREVGNSGHSYGSVSWLPRMVQQNSTERDTAWLIWFIFCQKDAYFSEYLAYLEWCFYVGSRAVEILLLFIKCWTRTLTITLLLSFAPNIFRSEGFITQTCRSNRKCYYQTFDHNWDLHLIRCFSVCGLQATTSGTAGLALV